MAEENFLNPSKQAATDDASALGDKKVSIGMPVFNCAPYVSRAIESILGQTHRDFELIISDNASTDGTGEICQTYAAKDSRIRYFRQPENIGASNNFKFVLQQARHELFIWAAGDDWWDSDRLEILVDAIRAEDAVVVGAVRRYLNDFPVAEYVPKPFAKGDAMAFILREESRCEKVYYIYGLGWRAKMCSASTGLGSGYAEDAIFCYKLLWQGSLKPVAGATLHITTHLSSEGARLASNYRYSWRRLLFAAHPWSYYRRYLENTPAGKMGLALITLVIKIPCAQLHIWYRAFCRIFLRRPYLHGALPRGRRAVCKL
jgi:glycosyltransferase involved in cell wall biosynthesis